MSACAAFHRTRRRFSTVAASRLLGFAIRRACRQDWRRYKATLLLGWGVGSWGAGAVGGSGGGLLCGVLPMLLGVLLRGRRARGGLCRRRGWSLVGLIVGQGG